MSRLFITILMLMFVTTGIGQENYLNPCSNWGRVIEQIQDYNESFDKKLNEEFKKDYLLRFISQPSFDREYAFQIEKTNNEYRIKIVLFKENLWNAKHRDSVKIESSIKLIDNNLISHLDSLFKKVTDSAITRKNCIVGGEDGETYYFFRQSESAEINCGECWSPSKGAPLFELVSICDKLIQYTLSDSVDISKLNNRIDELLNKIE